ncbi:centrosomal protein of 68 kDa isoform X2 [Sphaeramia orbicularis]|uniref:Centrosomal protein 68 n=1 Tax=Sphaeramia orbicularis TaxID=375764 RepID=A0A672ZSU2_9TELE|nr:centrosomal protein of 68 kDa isoform X2 [Sphaeramia orbicularis]
MEAKGCDLRWTMHHSELKHKGRVSGPSIKDGETDQAGDGGGPHRSVTVAPTSRYMTDRHYVPRKPLCSLIQHTSILKKTHPPTRPEQDTQPSVIRAEAQQPVNMTSLREVLTSEGISHPLSGISPPPPFKEDPVSLWRNSSFGSPLLGTRSHQQSLSCSILEVQRLNPPLRPQLTSTVLHPTYSPRSGYCRPGQADLRLGGNKVRGGGGTNSKGNTLSPYQANYWTCAIPKDLPPSSQHHSRSWDPNREYQALLDYTYPLRPGTSTKPPGNISLQSDRNLQDSGIELDQLCSSTSLSELNFPLSGTGQTRERSGFCIDQKSAYIMGGRSSGTPLSLTEPGISLDSCDSVCSSAFLPRTRCVGAEVDEEFRALPEQLKEMQLLSRQVKEMTAQLNWRVGTSWESLEPGTVSVQSPISPADKQEAEDSDHQTEDTDEGKEEPAPALQLISEAETCTKPLREGLSEASLQEVEALMEQLCGPQRCSGDPEDQDDQEDRDHSDSLMQHIQIFCSHLEQLIHWLHIVSKKMDMLAPPTVDIDSVKSSLAQYQSFQREVSSCHPLTSSVVHTGQLLLSCLNTTSPILRDTLLLIERQSRALEGHTEHFFSSILSAMDSLTRPSQSSPVLQMDEDGGHWGIKDSST